MYFTGDGARRDEDGYFWLMGRVDDVINVSGHRLGTAEIESALVSHSLVAEAAVVGFSHGIKGQGIYVFVTFKSVVEKAENLKKTLLGQSVGDVLDTISLLAIRFCGKSYSGIGIWWNILKRSLTDP